MCPRIWIVLSLVWAAGAVLADTSYRKIFLGDFILASDTETAEPILWQPAVEGLTRYQFSLPRSGISNALKYHDSAALFYLSQQSDLGIDVVYKERGQFRVSYSPETFRTVYKKTLTPALSYHLGVEKEAEEISLLLGGSWRAVTGHTQLDQTNATLSKSGANLSWTRTKLKNDERSERLYTLSSEAEALKASLGTRWFNVFQSADLLAEISLDTEGFRLGAQLEHGVGPANAHLGAVGNLTSRETDIILGLRYNLGDHTKLAATTQNGLSTSIATTLKPFRRAALARHWRDRVLLERHTAEATLPERMSFLSERPNAECLIECQGSTKDPRTVILNNFGLPGIIDLPNAQRLPDGELVLTQQIHDTLARTGMSSQILPRLGVAFRYSGHGRNGDEANERTNHDRSFDAHLSLMEESRYLPSLAIGLRDFIGTGWYSSEYIVGTKTYGNVVLTGGVGFGRLAGRHKITSPLSAVSDQFKTREANEVGRGGTFGTINWFQGDAAPFGGITFRYNDNLTVTAEYTSDLMLREASYLDVSSPWNFGAQYRLNDTLSLSAHYLHGSTASIGANINLNPKRPPAGAGKETAPVPMRARSGTTRLIATDRSTLLNVLKFDGFEVINLAEHPDYVRVDLRNTSYRSYAQALGRASATLQRFTANHIRRAVVVFHGASLELASYTVDLDRVSEEQAGGNTQIGPNGSIRAIDANPLTFGLEPSTKFNYGFGPYFTHRLFNPDLPLSAEAGAEISVKYNFSRNFSLSASLRKSVITTLTENKRLGNGGGSLPNVQSNWGHYDLEGQSGHIHDFSLNFVDRLSPNIFVRAHGGFLEPMFAGIGGELLYMPTSFPIAVGLDLHHVRQRDFDMRFDLQDYETTVGKVSLYYDNGGPFDLEINAGRYLAGDWGATTKLSRRFANGWEFGAYGTLTDVPFDVFGEGSFDKGIYINIPLDWLTGTPNMSKRNFTIRPITRDGGARLGTARQLYKMVRDAQEKHLAREIGRMWK